MVLSIKYESELVKSIQFDLAARFGSINERLYLLLVSSMPDINCGGQIFDLAFHPTHQTVYTGLLTGHIKAFTYDDQGNYQSSFALRPTKRSCRGLALSPGGDTLWSVGKGKALQYVEDTI